MRRFLFRPIGLNVFDSITTVVLVSMVDAGYSWWQYIGVFVAMQFISVCGAQPWRPAILALAARLRAVGL